VYRLTRLLARMAWSAQRAAWRTRRAVQLPKSSGGPQAGLTPLGLLHVHTLQRVAPKLAAAGLHTASRGALAVSLAGCCAYGLALAALVTNKATLSSAPDEEALRTAIEQRLRQAVMDRDARPIGALGPSLDAPSVAARVPAACIDLVLHQEDRHHSSSWRWHQGVDLMALPLAAVGRRGAGTLPMQVARVALDLRTNHTTLGRKRIELAAAGTVLNLYDGDMRAVARDYLAMAPFALALNGGGGEVAGLAAFASAVWRKPASDMSVEECAMAVASLPTPLWLNDAGARSLTRTLKVSERAHTLLVSAGLAGPTTALAIATLRDSLPIEGAETLSVVARRHLAPLKPLLISEVSP
jgi:membrane peptidoglycan carboxypeptidase